jgi:hypothetical protein
VSTSRPPRSVPLSAIEPHDVDPHDIAPPTVSAAMAAADEAHRDARFEEGVRTLRVGGASVQLSERILLVLAGIVAPLGVVMVFLGWWGAAHSPYLFEQVPYLISGGLIGLSFVFLGSFFYFAHWMTQLVKEHRVQSVALLEAVQRLQDEVAAVGGGRVSGAGLNGHAAPPVDDEPLVATLRGTMAHRAGCAVVAGKPDLRSVTAADGLTSCRLCHPF